MSNTDFTKLSDEDLQTAIYGLGERRDAIAQEMRLASAEQQKRESEASARRKLETMSDAERAALSQMIGAGSIASGEAVNNVDK
jgi:hypothetical protein